MNWLTKLRRRLALLLWKDVVEREMDEEMQAHLELEIEENERRGMSAAQARRAALVSFGGVERFKEQARDARGGRLLDDLLQDLRYAARTLRKSPGFTLAAILILAVGIGANAAVFSLLHTVLIRPLPYPEADRLIAIESTAGVEGATIPLSYPDMQDMVRMGSTLSEIGGAWYTNFTFTGDEGPERIPGAEVTANFNEILGVEPILGRGFLPEEQTPGAPRVVLIGAGLWQRRYGSDPDIIGKVITTGGSPSTIVGVMPPHFHFPELSQVWAPFNWPVADFRQARLISAVGRLAPDVTEAQAAAELEGVARRLSEMYPETNSEVGVRVEGFQEWVFGDSSQPVAVFYVVVSLVLLLACANVAGLLLARNETRRQEVGVRASLGAGRDRILRQLFTEGILLTGMGGFAGLFVGWFCRDLILALLPGEVPPYFWGGVDVQVLLSIAGIIALSGLLFGLAPALTLARTDLRKVLHSDGARVSGGPGRSSFRSMLVAGEIALALAVLTGANLMLKSVLEQRAVDPGFDAEGVATLFITLPDADWAERHARLAFFQSVLYELRGTPGVEEAAIASELPTGLTTGSQSLWVGGDELPPPGQLPRYRSTVCGEGYFSTLGVPILAGRDFNARDGVDEAPEVIIVSESFARRHWPGESALGKRVARAGGPLAEALWYEVVGVVGEVHNAGYGRPSEPAVYFPMEQITWGDVFLMVRTSGDPRRILGPIREMIWGINRNVPLSQASTLEAEILRENWQIPTFSWAFGLVSLIALSLAATGLYGIMAYAVSIRSREFALRVAMGAEPRSLKGRVIRGSMMVAGSGIVVGVALSLAGTRFLGELLFQVSPTDVGVYGISIAIMLGLAVVASYLPARRATRLDPVSVLNRE